MHLTTSPPASLPAGRLLSPQDAAFQLLEAAALAGYGSGGRAGLLPVLAAGQPVYREVDVQVVAGLIRTQLEAA